MVSVSTSSKCWNSTLETDEGCLIPYFLRFIIKKTSCYSILYHKAAENALLNTHQETYFTCMWSIEENQKSFTYRRV
jgi:hypothetical protein